MQQTMRRLAAFVLSVALLAGLGVNPATAKSVDQGCETDTMLHDSVSDELCATEDSPIDDSRAAKSETKSTTSVEPRNVKPQNEEPQNEEPRNVEPRNVEPRNVEPRNIEPVPRPIRTIREGQSTTFTAPNPSANDRRVVTRCAPFAGRRGRATPTPQFRPDGTLVCDYSIGVPYFDGISKTATSNSISTFGPCRGPYTVEVLTRDSRVEHAGGRRIKVTTSTSDNLDDTGTVEVEYFLVGTSTNTFAQTNPGATVHTSTSECTLERTARVQVNATRRPGMTAAVSRHAPPQGWLDGTTTSNWTCTQELIDYYRDELQSPAPCTLGDEVETTTKNTFPTPRRCTVVVTVAKNGKGFGSTSCLTSAQIDLYEAEIRAKHPDEQAINVSDLPTCPESTPHRRDERAT